MKKILKLTALTAVLLILVGGMTFCAIERDKEELVCNVKNPLTDLPWLKEIVDVVI